MTVSADTHVTLTEPSPSTSDAAILAQAVRWAFGQAFAGVTKLPPDILMLPGMSGRRYRCFVNALVERIKAARYLEVGSLGGSTMCAAIYGNEVEAVAIDNWSQFGGSAATLLGNVARFKGGAQVDLIERDFRMVDYGVLGRPFNLYLYDGPHQTKDQRDGIVLAQPALAASYVQIVDDWNHPDAREGTHAAITELGLRVDFMVQIRTTLDDQHASGATNEQSDWHNGVCVSVLTRT